jgi:hypothetical protein
MEPGITEVRKWTAKEDCARPQSKRGIDIVKAFMEAERAAYGPLCSASCSESDENDAQPGCHTWRRKDKAGRLPTLGECENLEDTNIPDPCQFFFSEAGCRFGDNCHFSHVVVPSVFAEPVCQFFFSEAGCRFGDNCAYSHVVSPKWESAEFEECDAFDETSEVTSAEDTVVTEPSAEEQESPSDLSD